MDHVYIAPIGVPTSRDAAKYSPPCNFPRLVNIPAPDVEEEAAEEEAEGIEEEAAEAVEMRGETSVGGRGLKG